MNTKYLAIISLICMVLLVGCEGEGEVEVDSPFIGGDEGLTAEFEPIGIEDGGEYWVYETENMPLTVLVNNKGEQAVEAGDLKVELKGILISDFSGIVSDTLTNQEKIEGISTFNMEGGEDLIDFTPGEGAVYLQEIHGATSIPLNPLIVYTYKYKTSAIVPLVCFKENLRNTRLCEVQEKKEVFSSGAPIQVTSAEEDTAGAGRIALTFELENKGDGRSASPGTEFNPSYDTVSYTLEPEEQRARWQCTSAGRENQARLTDGKAVIRCRLKDSLPEGVLYTKLIGLNIEYDYREEEKVTINIRKIE